MFLKDKRVVTSVSLLLIIVLVSVIYSTYFSQSPVNSIPSSAYEDSEHVKPQPNKNKSLNEVTLDTDTPPTETAQLEFIEEIRCSAHFENINTSAEAVQHRHYERLTNSLRAYDRRYRTDDLLLFGELVGLNIDDTMSLLYGYEPTSKDEKNKHLEETDYFLIFSDANRNKKQMNREEQMLLWEMSRKSDINAFVKAFEDEKLSPHKSYISQSLLAVIIQKTPDFDKPEIERLVSLDLEVDFDSIAYAVEAGKSKSAIEFLIELYDGDLDQEWSHGNYAMNLVLAAARENRVELVELFSGLGVKKQTKHSILDVLPSPENEYEIEKLIDIATATFALDDGQRPFYKESANRLETWMPEVIKEAYINQLQVERSLPPKLEERLESFIAWHERVSNKIAKAQAFEARCLQHHGMSLADAIKQQAEQVTDSKGLTYFEKLRYLELEKAQLLHRQSEINAKSTADNQTHDAEEISEDVGRQINDAVLQLQTFAIARNQDGFLQTYDRLERVVFAHNLSEVEDIEELAMSIAVSARAYDIAIAFGKQIGHFPDNTALMLYGLNDLNKLQQLANLGVDLTFSDGSDNILTKVLKYNPNSELVAFLLQNGVPTKPSRLGIDALDIALNDLRFFRYSSYKRKAKRHVDRAKNVALLFKHKHPVESSHRHRIYELGKTNAKALKITSTILPKLVIHFTAE